MQAIKTKYLPATNYDPSSIKAECDTEFITIPYDHNLTTQEIHQKAAYLLIQKLGWKPTKMYTGALSNCYVHILEYEIPQYIPMQDLPEFLKPQA